MVNSVNSLRTSVFETGEEIMDMEIELSTSDFVDTYRYVVANIYELGDAVFLVQMKLLRKILSCSVCSNLVCQPCSVEGCDHFTCKNCLGMEKQAIYWDTCDNINCHDWSKHELDELLLCYVTMFKDLCKFICTTNVIRNHVQEDPSSPLWELVKEGALADLSQFDALDENENDNPEFLLEHLNDENIGRALEVEEPSYTEHLLNGVQIKVEEPDPPSDSSNHATSWMTKDPNASPVIINLTSLSSLGAHSGADPMIQTQNQIVQKWAENHHSNNAHLVDPLGQNSGSSNTNSNESSSGGPIGQTFSSSIVGSVVRTDESIVPAKKLKVRLPKPKTQPKIRRGCRCGNAAAVPGKLTCCGQRCPCYVEAKACFDCRCKGCRNPHLPGGKKLLQGINAVIDTKTNTTVQLPPSAMTPMVGASGETVYGNPSMMKPTYLRGISQGSSFTQVYPVGTVANLGGYSFPLPILSVSQHAQQQDPLSLSSGMKTSQTFTMDY